MSRNNDIIMLLGAGASIEAGIPGSQGMIENIEERLRESDWEQFRELYYLIKSSITYSYGLRGEFEPRNFYNVELLVSTMIELERQEKHPIYPFISDWKSHLTKLADTKFKRIEEFRLRILNELKGWVQPSNDSESDYYRGLQTLQQHLNYPLKIFSLNYDLCVERCGHDKFRIETGFEQKGKKRVWDWRRFDESSPNWSQMPSEVILYKLHGSIDWTRDDAGNLVKTDDKGARTAGKDLPLIFGTDRKLEAADPFLFYAYEFRRCTLEAKVILAIGYGFGDEHINKMLRQAIKTEPVMKLAVVANTGTTPEALAERAAFIAKRVDIPTRRVHVIPGTAKSFFEDPNIGQLVTGLVQPDQTTTEF